VTSARMWRRQLEKEYVVVLAINFAQVVRVRGG